MPSHDPRIDAYIANAAPFARPILEKLRAIVHEACPETVETMKWSMPCFMHAGAILCSMAAFKQHVSFGFWKHALVMGEGVERDGMGSFGRMASTRDLPPKKELLALLAKAARLNEQGVKAAVARKAAPKPPPAAPGDLVAALGKNKAAATTFMGFPPGQQREYIDWLTQAKREETRAKRLAQAVEWLAEGKRRNWKYENC